MLFQPGKSAKPKQERTQTKTPTLANAPGVKVGLSIVWEHGNKSDGLTPVEVQTIRKETGHKSLNDFRILQIKNLMQTKTCAQIVAHFRGRKGYSERTIKRYHAALSKAGGGGK